VPPPKQKAGIGGDRWAVRWAVRWRHTELGGKYFAASCTGRLGGRLGGGTVILIGKYLYGEIRWAVRRRDSDFDG
jgi:hypothetical protein